MKGFFFLKIGRERGGGREGGIRDLVIKGIVYLQTGRRADGALGRTRSGAERMGWEFRQVHVRLENASRRRLGPITYFQEGR